MFKLGISHPAIKAGSDIIPKCYFKNGSVSDIDVAYLDLPAWLVMYYMYTF